MPRLYYDTAQKIYVLFKKHPVMSVLLEEFSIDTDENLNEIEDSNLKSVCDYLILNDDIIQESNLSFEYLDDGNAVNEFVDNIAELYGFSGGPPWSIFVSPGGIKLPQLLYMTLYLYKFGNADNFYSKNIFRFIPENDREYIQSQPKLKLVVEALGRKIDDLEDRISRMFDVIDIDETPDALLDYLGQNLGYEREDFTLSSVSFRELLKNIIEIYKIKGTNYSFSFFFKFLGFDVELKEFFYNKDVKNPESFPGTEKDDVEYFLTSTNPTLETGDDDQGIHLSPAKFLDQTRNLNEWKIEYLNLESHFCVNPSEYMRGLETFNNDGLTWHQSPWTYFKTNLIEYDLSFLKSLEDKGLTSDKNETIKKYVKFLSPTYLFTWINVNLNPWEELLDSMTDNLDVDENSWIQISKTLGDPRPSIDFAPWPAPWPAHQPGEMGVPEHDEEEPWVRTVSSTPGFGGLYNDENYLDYEDMGYYIEIYNSSSPLDPPDLNKEHLLFSIQNFMDLDGVDQIGTYLRHNGVHIRQPGHPKYITNTFHAGKTNMLFDNVGIQIKLFDAEDIEENWEDYSSKPWPATPTYFDPSDSNLIKNTSIINFEWNQIKLESLDGYRIQLSTDINFVSTIIDDSSLNNIHNYYTSSSLNNDRYYWRISTKNKLGGQDPWGVWSSVNRFTLQNTPFPYDGEVLDFETIFVKSNVIDTVLKTTFDILWTKELITNRYEIQISITSDFNYVILDRETVTNNFVVSLENGTYYWRYKAKNINTGWSDWRSNYSFTINFNGG